MKLSQIFSITLILLCSLSAEVTIPDPIAWQQSSSTGGAQRQKYLPSEKNWGSYPFNRGKETGNTIGLAGCSLLSTVNVLYYKKKKFVNPIVLAKYAIEKGFRVPGVDGVQIGFFSSFIKSNLQKYGMKYVKSTTSASEALSHIRKGGQSISNIYGHWIAIVNYNKSTQKYLILDSASGSPRSSNIRWTDKTNGVAWLSSSQLSEGGRSGFYGINGRYSMLISFS